MNFWNTSFWTSVGISARLVSQFVVAKAISVFAGTAAFGVFGQFISFVTVTQITSGSTIRSGIIKYVSQYHEERDTLSLFTVNALKLGIILSVITGLVIVLLSKTISNLIFHTQEYWWALVVFGTSLFTYVVYQLISAVFTGLNQIKIFALISVYGAILSAIITSGLCYFFSTEGALLGFVISQICFAILCLIFAPRLEINWKLLKQKMNMPVIKKLLKFSIMALISSFTLPLIEMILRTYVAGQSSWSDVGLWQGILKISDAYLLIAINILTTYVFPKYARITEKKLLQKEMYLILLKMLPALLLAGFFVFLFRRYIILILFSKDFLPMQDLFAYQLLGDIFKVAGSIMLYVLLAKEKITLFCFFTIFFGAVLLILSLIFYNLYGLVGLTMGFCISYLMFFVFMLFWTPFYFKYSKLKLR